MEYEEREKLKKEGWRLFSEATEPSQKSLILFEYIITAHYWRSLEGLQARKDYKKCLIKIRGNEYYKGYELDIDHYTEHWLFAQRNSNCMQNVGLEYFTEYWYKPKQCKYLPDGYSSYFFEQKSKG